MSNAKRIALIALFALCIFSAALFAGCRVGTRSYQEYVEANNATIRVTYNANGGTFETNKAVKEIFYKENSRLADIGNVKVSGNNIQIRKPGYTFAGWYSAEKDANGNVVYEDEANGIVRLGEKFDFSYRLKKDDRIYLYADWVPEVKINIHLVCDEPITVSKTEDGETNEYTYSKGDVITQFSFGSGDTLGIPAEDTAPVASKNATFIRMYMDEDCKIPFSGTAVKPDQGNLSLYAHYIPGIWTLVKTASNVSSMFNSVAAATNKYYILEDIDMNGSFFGTFSRFGCTIEGNGHTISNFGLERASLNTSSTLVSGFGEILSTAKINNLTFKDVTVRLSTRDNTIINALYLFSHRVNSGAELNVTFENCNLELDNAGNSTTISNIIPNLEGEIKTGHWMFNTADGVNSDDDFLSLPEYRGIKLVGEFNLRFKEESEDISEIEYKTVFTRTFNNNETKEVQ